MCSDYIVNDKTFKGENFDNLLGSLTLVGITFIVML